jgi:hypothetical protein
VASIDPFTVWISVAASDQCLVRESECHKIAKDPVQHQRSKNIELHMHFIRKLIHDQVIEVLIFPTEYQVADIFTKSLTEAKFSKLRSMLGVQEVVIKGGYDLIPPSFSYCVTIVNPSILSQVVLKGGC